MYLINKIKNNQSHIEDTDVCGKLILIETYTY